MKLQIIFRLKCYQKAYKGDVLHNKLYCDFLGNRETKSVKTKDNKNTKNKITQLFIFDYSEVMIVTLQTMGCFGIMHVKLLMIFWHCLDRFNRLNYLLKEVF